MLSLFSPRSRNLVTLAALLAVLRPGMSPRAKLTFAAPKAKPHTAGTSPDPWTPAQTIEPAALVKELNGDNGRRFIVVCVGFHTLYEGAHISGASFRGPASTPQGLADLRKWAQRLPRSTRIVLYCGCCPLTRCPNLRPAFQALRDMGFARVRVLLIPKDFASNWVAAGYPVAKGH